MHYQRLRISYAADVKNQLQSAHQGRGCVEASFYAESEHASETVPEIFACKLVVRIAPQTHVVHTLNSRMTFKELSYCKCICAASLGPQRQSLKTLKHKE